MIAMGESAIPPSDTQHVESCEQCRRELHSLQRVADLARAGTPDATLGTPSPEVWTRISETLGLSPDVAPAPFTDAPTPAAPVPVAAEESAAAEASVAPVTSISRRANRPWIAFAIAAAVVIIIVGGIAGTLLLQRPTGTVLADAQLDPLPDWSGSTGTATVEAAENGHREVVVNLEPSADGSGFREVWLISPDLSGLVSVGVLAGSEGRFAIPDDLDLDEYPIVDVSEEPLDGDPAHSGDSIVRGSLSS